MARNSKYIKCLPLKQTVNDLKSGKLPLLEFIEEICNRIDQVEPHIHSLLPEVNRRERLRKEANELLAKFPNPTNRPPLFGIPVGVKDLFNVDGFETKAGSALPSSLFKGNEASIVSQLKKNGALILGKTVSTEFAYFEPGPTCNPHNIKHTPGGSSSGSAAAVASGLTPLALGTQTIGSITRPAAFCGIYGFKPTSGRIYTDGVVPFSPTADHIGFFTQDFDGIELACSVLVPNWKPNGMQLTSKSVIGVATGSYLQQANSEILSKYNEVIQLLKQNGFKVIEVDVFGDIEKVNASHKRIVAYDFAKVHEKWFKQYESLYRLNTKKLVLEGQNISHETWLQACNERDVTKLYVERIQNENEINIWLTPATISVATEGLSSTGSPLMNLPWTYIGVPTLSIPVGENELGLPIGIQVAGAFGKDEELIENCLVVNNLLKD
jgi:Asp-tRNA(Asn)/Glu-tRNA(Gln) amidotransferase A subunit family amidase